MREYIFAIVCFSFAVGALLLISPDGIRSGLKKHLRLIGSFALICIIIQPASSFLDKIDELSKGDFSGIFEAPQESELYEDYDRIYQDYLEGGYGQNLGSAVKDSLFEKFEIKKENVRVLVEFHEPDGSGIKKPKKITVILSDEAKYKDPEEIKSFVSSVFECQSEVAVE